MVTDAGGAVGLEDAVRGRAAGVHDALRDALVVEVGDLLPQVEVLQQRRTACAGLQRVVGVGQPQALRGGQIVAGLGALNGALPAWRHRSGRPGRALTGRICVGTA